MIHPPHSRAPLRLAAAALGIGLAACAGFRPAPPGSPAPGYAIVHEVKSVYQRITVVDTLSGFRQLLFDARLDGSDPIQSEMSLADPPALTRPYPRYLMTALPAAARLERVLIVGLGGASMQRWLRRLLPDLVIESVEIDSEVRRVAREYFGLREDERQIVHVEDGAAFVARPGPAYDVIFLDAFGPSSIPEPLRTREFLAAVKSRLSEGGVVCANVWFGAPEYYEVMKAYEAIFPERYLVRCGEGSANRIILALKSKAGLGMRGWIKKAEAFEKARPTGLDLPGMLRRRPMGERDPSLP
jgi:spermidine synthase